jgi:aspartate aminotransferase
MNKLQASKRANSVIASPIRKFLPFVYELEAKGIHVYKLNVGDPDLPVPSAFFRVVKGYKDKNLHYAPSPGIPEHLDAWIKYYRKFGLKLKRENILPTVGGAEAILLALNALTDPGDEIIMFEPHYASYKGLGAMAGVKLVPVSLDIKNNFAVPDASTIEAKVSKKTKVIVVVNPDNPTGKVWSDAEFRSVMQVAKKYNLFVLSDETYREIRFQGRPNTFLAFPGARERVVLVDSLSKRFSGPGIRIGSIVTYNQEVMQGVLKFAMSRLSAPTLGQLGTIPLLDNSKKLTDKVRAEYKRRRDVVYKSMSQMPGVKCHEPQGAFYMVAELPVKSSEDFIKFLVSGWHYQGHTVLMAPMADFYITKGRGLREIRIAYVINTRELKESMKVLAKALEDYKSRKK